MGCSTSLETLEKEFVFDPAGKRIAVWGRPSRSLITVIDEMCWLQK